MQHRLAQLSESSTDLINQELFVNTGKAPTQENVWQARMTTPRPVLSTGYIAAGREWRAAGTSSLGEL